MKGSRNRFRQRSAFTLIELLLVLVILGVLAALVVPKFTGRSQQARETAAKTDISRISTALNAFEIDIGRYPTNDEGLSALINPPSTTQGAPRSAYVYRFPGQRNPGSFDLLSPGADGREGTADDIGNWD
jgi:general secretion pathway protein G